MARKPNIQQISLDGWTKTQSGNYYNSDFGVYIDSNDAREVLTAIGAKCTKGIIVVDRKAANSIGQIYTTWWLKKQLDLSDFMPEDNTEE